jgi:hypothetical protein
MGTEEGGHALGELEADDETDGDDPRTTRWWVFAARCAGVSTHTLNVGAGEK